jgi:ABC-2 type transport system ATP-binding protein
VIHGPKILFLDEPFEGVDAIASNTLKAMLMGMIARGATIFLTSHVLEIVERLCSHIGIIDKGRLIASGSLEHLRAGVEASNVAPGEKLTLEQIFIQIVGTQGASSGLADATTAVLPPPRELSWLS